ncbi:Phosphotyrosyl phosphatase activator [Coprinopsis sp. MPI-PUGE-AT-0042]|nr:Phosphotyrosyl phosphatase activator [Coprinopsis sp. MPI-PUGE-AT-0042]
MVHNAPSSISVGNPETVADIEGFRPPNKRILTPEQLLAFQQSSTHTDIIAFITRLNGSIKGAKLYDKPEGEEHPTIRALGRILDEVKQIAEDTPPIENAGSRFGNPAFRTFYDRISEATDALHKTHLVPLGLPSEALEEIGAYFKECWGNRTRIDYGSGMELNWLCWALCLEKLGLFSEPSSGMSSPTPTISFDKALVLRVFWSYIQTMRLLQSKYWLEPAGSHGVWGLDDYHFLPFLWGSGQLVDHKFIRPRAIHDAEVVEEYAKDYMYFACIAFINSIKTASLRWHSPMLDDISAVKSWSKVNEGMMKMYRAEVLGKLPVVQHFLFGSLLPFSEAVVSPSSGSPLPSPGAAQQEGVSDENAASLQPALSSTGDHEHSPGCGHGHAHPLVPRNIHPKVLESLKAKGELGELNPEGDLGGAGQREVGWGDCCGIPVPSVFGAAAEQGAVGQSGGGYVLSGVRPVPFD